MRYYLPDSRDAIDLTYNFDSDSRMPDRQTRDDVYCHEVLGRPYDGMLISYAAIANGRYPAAARRRLYREGLRAFFRAPPWLTFMGDCGAFTYFKENAPIYSVNEVAEFYATVRVDYGLAVDHIVAGYCDDDAAEPTEEMRRRYDLTLALASDFLAASKSHAFTPVGVSQGWSPASFALAVAALQRMGYGYIALGGLVRLKTDQLLRVLQAVDAVRKPSTRLHLLGVTRPGNVAEYHACGVASIDSTSPLRRAWMDKRANYLLGNTWYAALRIPSSDSSRVRKRIESGEINGEVLRRLEERALAEVAGFAQRKGSLNSTLDALLSYSALHSPEDVRTTDYVRTLTERPWERCTCAVCKRLGHHVIIFRGAERNRGRGFHNVGQFYTGLQNELRSEATA